jgi:hypothetical protein
MRCVVNPDLASRITSAETGLGIEEGDRSEERACLGLAESADQVVGAPPSTLALADLLELLLGVGRRNGDARTARGERDSEREGERRAAHACQSSGAVGDRQANPAMMFEARRGEVRHSVW